MTSSTPIAQAVEPLRLDAIARSVAFMASRILAARNALEIGGWDLKVVAPYPHSRMSRREYMMAKAKHDFFSQLTKWTQASRSTNSPCPVVFREEMVAVLIKEAQDIAGASFDAFIAKLNAKVGDHSAAKLLVEGTWGYSIIEVTTPAGVQRWKTQQIVNCSVLGLLFNQWPTRLMK